MAQRDAKIRLFVPQPFDAGRKIVLPPDQSHYLVTVMRLAEGAVISIFNGTDGEWTAALSDARKRAVTLECRAQTRPQDAQADLWLCFAPIKKARTDFIAEKACEMGAARLCPVLTQHTNADRVRTDRLQAHAVEAAEQCGILSVPKVDAPVQLMPLLEGWPVYRRIMFCDETGGGAPARDVLTAEGSGPWAILIGPEGGFSSEEIARLNAAPFAHAVSLGPRILRADTAAVAALTIWQDVLGDWRGARS
jgi:16S rRNA (uracil1498-N3)-methyltransferase